MQLSFKTLALIFFGFLTVSIFAQTKTLTVQINYIEPYCGGARPTPEMEKDAQTPKPYANRTVYVVSGKGKSDSVKTDNNGIAIFKLKPGKYKVLESWKFFKQTPDRSPSDRFIPDCLVKEWDKEFMQIQVTRKSITKTDMYELVNHCDYKLPCFLEGFKPPKRQ